MLVKTSHWNLENICDTIMANHTNPVAILAISFTGRVTSGPIATSKVFSTRANVSRLLLSDTSFGNRGRHHSRMPASESIKVPMMSNVTPLKLVVLWSHDVGCADAQKGEKRRRRDC